MDVVMGLILWVDFLFNSSSCASKWKTIHLFHNFFKTLSLPWSTGREELDSSYHFILLFFLISSIAHV
jgi:hypothetical protein